MIKEMKEKNYIFLNSAKIIDENSDMYILLTIYSETKNNKIKLILNSIEISKTLLTYGKERLSFLDRNVKFNLPFDNLNNNNYYLNIRTIKGTQKLIIEGVETISDLNGIYYIELQSNPSGKSIEINNLNNVEKEQGIIINYSKAKEDKLFKLEKNIKN